MINHEQAVAHRAFEVLRPLTAEERDDFVNALESLGLRIADFYFGFTHAIGLLYRDAAKDNAGATTLLRELCSWLVPENDETTVDLAKRKPDYYAEKLIDAAGDGTPAEHDKYWSISERALQFVEHLKAFS